MNPSANTEQERIRALRELIYTRAPESRFDPAPARLLEHLRAQFPALPEHLHELMIQVGQGTIGDSRYQIYAPMEPSEIYDEEWTRKFAGLVIVGHDYAGFQAAYDSRGTPWTFGEISPRGGFAAHDKYQDFIDFLSDWILDPAQWSPA